ncbi:Mobile element protein, partial [Vibrio mimicus]
RAAITETPEGSDFTSVKAHIESLKIEQHTAPSHFPFVGNPRELMPEGILFRLTDYQALVDWLSACTQVERGRLVGSGRAIKAALPHLNRKRASGLRLPDS